MPTVSGLQRRIRRMFSTKSQLDFTIAPEVIDDAFSQVIRTIAAEGDVHNVLEIGSSSGAGSTASLVDAMREKPLKSLYCLELSKPRFDQLRLRYADLEWVYCYNLPSIALDRMPGSEYVDTFFRENPQSPITRHGLNEVKRWLQQDVDYIERNNFAGTGIQAALRQAEVELFDLVLIDGSEFTGEAELNEVYGARYFLLDDTLTLKNLANFERLAADPAYELIAEDRECRNGFAAFKKVGFATSHEDSSSD
jgi:hypothetical protein